MPQQLINIKDLRQQLIENYVKGKFDGKYELISCGVDEMVRSHIQSLLKFIDQEIERKGKQKIIKESHPFHANFAPLEGHVKGFNECVDEDIAHLKSLKEELSK